MDKILDLWKSRKYLEIGAIVFGNAPRNTQAAWGTKFLTMACFKTAETSEGIAGVLKIASDSGLWSQARHHFKIVRRESLLLQGKKDKDPSLEIHLYVAGLAELAVKLMYNATDPPDEFDRDTGHYVIVAIGRLCELLGDTEFTLDVLHSISEDYSIARSCGGS